jgi:5'-AMP-activated protein kinase regulatory beta subunit
MHRSGNDFSYVHNLKRGKHAFKFIVDDEWRFAPDQPTLPDIEGRINNFIDVSNFTAYAGDEKFFEKSKERKIEDSEYGQVIPALKEYTNEPPSLPPHLRLIILNKPPPTADPLALPIPQHVSLNHLYCTAIRDGMMVLGATQRYRQKHITLVFYSLMPGAKNAGR